MKSLSLLVALLAVGFAVSFVVVQNSNIVECDLCKLAMKLVDDGVDLGIDAGVDIFIKACEELIPGKIGKKECKAFADNDLEKIIHELEKGTDPKSLCHDIHMCKKGK